MTDEIAAWLAAVIGVALFADILFNDGAAIVFLFRKFLELIEWIAFWR